MSADIQVSENFIFEIVRRNPAAAEWVAALPATIARLCRLWNLEIDGNPTYGKTSMVLPVTSTWGDAALKLVSPVINIGTEIRALNVLAGEAMVLLIDASESDGGLLLERLESASLMESQTPEVAVGIAGRIAQLIGKTPAPPDTTSLADDASGWLIGIRQQHEIALATRTNFSEAEFSLALEIIDSMQSLDSSTMTHGDLSMENILRSPSRGWVAIDPLLVSGPITNEAHTVVRSFLPQILQSAHPAQRLDDLTRTFCDAAGADFLEARRISYARYVASYYWDSQNAGTSETSERLHRATLLTYEAITK